MKETIFYHPDDPKMTPIQETIKGYYYGKQLVPIAKAYEEEFSYKCDKGMKLLGFVKEDQVPRQSFMSNTEMLIPTEDAKSKKIMLALVTACQ